MKAYQPVVASLLNRRRARALTGEERDFWTHAGSAQSVFGRRLVVSARKPAGDGAGTPRDTAPGTS